MKTALLSKAALCICPPAMLATTAAYVPPVRSAVHQATRPHAKAPSANRARPQRTAATVAAVPCPPALLAAPLVPQSTFAEVVPDDSVGAAPFVGGSAAPGVVIGGIGPGVGGGGGGGGGGPGGGNPGGGGDGGTVVPPPPVIAVPEPSTWMMMLIGFGLLGAGLRLRRPAKRPTSTKRRRKLAYAGGGVLAAALEPVSAMGVAAAGTGSKMTILAKAAMCVCPPALMVATVATVPEARKAVYAATAPKQALPSAPSAVVTPPCDPNLPAPVIATS